jgi:lipoate-protein ligase A
MSLHVLPTRAAGAAENMATDFLLLQRYPEGATPRFRHYGWRAPAFTFGYAQKIGFVREHLPAGGPFDLCRRPTGGGIVDHRDDWTYALVIPRGHPLEETRAAQSYRAVHEAAVSALQAQGVEAALQLVEPAADDGADARVSPAGVCFQRAEVFDVVHAASGEKIAGAAQKRNKHGLLFQGSLWRPALGRGAEGFDWEAFEAAFVEALAVALALDAQRVPWPELNEDEVAGLTEQYSSPEWLEYR